jgi:putative mRNA 3-end processing factor
VVVSGDYKRRADPTCRPFVPVPCDVFITEATFGLPVFRHPDTGGEIDRLLHRLHSPTRRDACWSAPMRSARRSG